MKKLESLTTKEYKNKRFTCLIHRRGGKIVCAEYFYTKDHEEWHEEIGLWFNGNRLTDYDGCFFLPRLVFDSLVSEGIMMEEFKNCITPR